MDAIGDIMRFAVIGMGSVVLLLASVFVGVLVLRRRTAMKGV